MINCNENEKDNGRINHRKKTYIDQDVDIETNIEKIIACLGKIIWGRRCCRRPQNG